MSSQHSDWRRRSRECARWHRRRAAAAARAAALAAEGLSALAGASPLLPCTSASGGGAACAHCTAAAAPGSWVSSLLAVGASFFAEAAAAVIASGAAHRLAVNGIEILRANAFSLTAAAFVGLLRARAPVAFTDAPGETSVNGRISLPVPHAAVLRRALLAFARAVQPGVFHDRLEDTELSFLYLTLVSTSLTQAWHRDYVSFDAAVVFMIPLDDALGSTEWQTGTHAAAGASAGGPVLKSDASPGCVSLFHPRILHRGIATGSLRRCLYASVRQLGTRAAAAEAAARVDRSAPTFDEGVYNECVERPLQVMLREDEARRG